MIKDDYREDGIEYIINLGLGAVRSHTSLVRNFGLIECKLDLAGLMSEGKGFLSTNGNVSCPHRFDFRLARA